MMWIVTQIIAMLAVTLKQTLYRLYDWSWWLVLLVFGVVLIIELSLSHSFAHTPSFFRAWFLGIAVLALMGFGVSFLYFKEVPTFLNLIGAALAVGGAVLLIIKG